MVTPVYPASNNQQAIDLNISNANQFFTILQGGIDDFIPTYEGNGEIPSVAKALNEAAAYKVPLAWQTTGEETDLLQPREYNGDIYVPLSVPAPFSGAPSNSFWRLYSEKSAQILIDNLTFTGDSVTTDFSIPSMVVDDPAAYLVSVDGVDQRPTIDYTVNVGTDTLSFTEAPPATEADNISVTVLGALRGALAEGIYETVADGLDETVDGGFFHVVNTSDPEAFIDLYKNNGGSALLIDTYPNSVAYNNLANAVVYEAALASNTIGEGSDKVAHTGTSDTVTEALDKLELNKLNNSDLAKENKIWPGNFATWQRATALNLEIGHRTGVADGVSVARADFSGGITIESATGDIMPTAIRIQRISGTSGTSPCNAVLTLTERESRALAGKSGTLQFWGKKSSGFAGGNVSVSLQCNDGFEQAITDVSGEYTENHSNLLTITQALTESAPSTPYSNQVTIPEDCTQVSIKLSVSFSGTAGGDDWVQFEGVAFVESESWSVLSDMAFSAALFSGKTRYQATYPYGLTRGNPTFNGTESAVAASSDPVYALSAPVRFSPSLAVPPVFYFLSPTSGTESRIHHVQGDANINGLAYNLSETGAQVRNNDAGVTDGGVYVFHWVAESII